MAGAGEGEAVGLLAGPEEAARCIIVGLPPVLLLFEAFDGVGEAALFLGGGNEGSLNVPGVCTGAEDPIVGGPAVLSSDGGSSSSSSVGVAASGEGLGFGTEDEAFCVPDEVGVGVEPDGLASEAGIEALRATVLLRVGLNFLLFAMISALPMCWERVLT